MINLKTDPGKLRALQLQELQDGADRVVEGFRRNVARLEAAIVGHEEAHARFSGANLPNLLRDAVVAYAQDLRVTPECPAGFSIKLTAMQAPVGVYRAYFLMYRLDADEAPLSVLPVDDRLSKSVDDLEISVRTANCLQNLNIRTIGELASHTESDLLKRRNFGRKSLKEVKTILAAMGLALRTRPEEARR